MWNAEFPKDQTPASTPDEAAERILALIVNADWRARRKPDKRDGEVSFKMAGFANMTQAGFLYGLGAAYAAVTGLEPPAEYMPTSDVF